MANGAGISVMKPFGGGQLLNAKTSPFKQALTKTQCIRYALDRPAVLTVLPGVRNSQDLKDVLSYLDASEEEQDYSVIGQFTPQNAEPTIVLLPVVAKFFEAVDPGQRQQALDSMAF